MESNLSSTLARFGPPNTTGRCFEWFAENGLSENVTFGTVVNICGGNSGWGPFAFPGREVLTIILSVLCVLLNGLVVFGVTKLQQKKPLYYLIANLAVTDIMTNLVGNVMLELTEAVTYREFIVFIVTVLHFPVILSLTGLVLLSVDRYASVQHPILYHATVGGEHVLAAVAGAWVSAALLCFSPVMGWNCNGLETNDELCFLGAVEGSYILFMTVLCAVGVGVVVFTNARVFVTLRQRLAVAADGNQQQQDGRVHMNQQQIVSAQKKAKSVLLIIAVFLVAWLLFLWWQLTVLVSIYSSWDSLSGIGINLQFRFVFLVVLWISPIVNPLVYAFRLPALRRVVWDSLRNGGVRLWRRLVPSQQVHPAGIEMPAVDP
ncbi:CNR2 [Branchiostoma lanceolatum]|uniref:CNR2 protein n=1 Tax=Branchiostoma lanceolatum TaxID=7740 RepID=A0A8K0EIU0_BRALA|nr:CNR2 [Branchiostoma lanceolatum]